MFIDFFPWTNRFLFQHMNGIILYSILFRLRSLGIRFWFPLDNALATPARPYPVDQRSRPWRKKQGAKQTSQYFPTCQQTQHKQHTSTTCLTAHCSTTCTQKSTRKERIQSKIWSLMCRTHNSQVSMTQLCLSPSIRTANMAARASSVAFARSFGNGCGVAPADPTTWEVTENK